MAVLHRLQAKYHCLCCRPAPWDGLPQSWDATRTASLCLQCEGAVFSVAANCLRAVTVCGVHRLCCVVTTGMQKCFSVSSNLSAQPRGCAAWYASILLPLAVCGRGGLGAPGSNMAAALQSSSTVPGMVPTVQLLWEAEAGGVRMRFHMMPSVGRVLVSCGFAALPAVMVVGDAGGLCSRWGAPAKEACCLCSMVCAASFPPAASSGSVQMRIGPSEEIMQVDRLSVLSQPRIFLLQHQQGLI